MTGNLAQNEQTARRTALAALFVLLVIALGIFGMAQLHHLDPYTEEVLRLSGNPTQGEAIFQMNCSVCHGLNGLGAVGPSLHGVASRKSQTDLINQVTGGKTPPMPEFKPTPQEMADLLSYLHEL